MGTARTSEIVIRVGLDAAGVPEHIKWSASEGQPEPKPCKAFLLSLWDEQEAHALAIDLWTKEMRVDEMNRLIHQTLLTLAETHRKATHNKELLAILVDCAEAFARKTGIIS